MKKVMTLLLLTSVGISSLKAAEKEQTGGIIKPLLYATGALSFLGCCSYWLYKTSKREANKRRQGHVVTEASASYTIPAPGTGRWQGLQGASATAGIVGLLTLGSAVSAKDANIFSASLLSIPLSYSLYQLFGKRKDALQKEYRDANEDAYKEQLEINKDFENKQYLAEIETQREKERIKAEQLLRSYHLSKKHLQHMAIYDNAIANK
jgi:hypothetical protein